MSLWENNTSEDTSSSCYGYDGTSFVKWRESCFKIAGSNKDSEFTATNFRDGDAAWSR